MRRALLLMMLASCGAPVPSLLELDGVSAGSVGLVTSGSGGSPCGASSLRLTLGPNMSAAARAWLEEALARKQAVHDVAIFLTSTSQKLSFSTKTLARVEFPRAQAGDLSPVSFVVEASTTAPATCTAQSSLVLAQKTQLASAWAARSAVADQVEVRIGSTTVQKPVLRSYASWTANELRIEGAPANLQHLSQWAAHVNDAGVLSEAEFTDVRVTPLDSALKPLFTIHWYGSAMLTLHSEDGGLVVEGTVDRPHLVSTP